LSGLPVAGSILIEFGTPAPNEFGTLTPGAPRIVEKTRIL